MKSQTIMIREIINFVKDLKQDYPEVFDLNKRPSLGLHLWVELDEEGNWKNNPPEEGKDYVVYDGKMDLEKLHYKAIQYSEFGRTVGGITDTNKCLDLPAKKIHSCSPFIISFRRKEFTNVTDRINRYFEKATFVCLEKEDEINIQKIKTFKNKFQDYISFIQGLRITTTEKNGEQKIIPLIDTFKDDFYISIYLKNIDLKTYKIAHNKYLEDKLFNNNKYNHQDKNTDELYGLSNYSNGANSKKPFLEHKTGLMHKGINGRILASEAAALNQFEILLVKRVLPNPLPIFIDKSEFKKNAEIVSVFNNEGERKFSYSQLLKKLYENDNQRIVSNYYLLNINRGVVADFDFVSNFQYKLQKFVIENLFQITHKKELLPSIKLHTIFGFENIIVTKIFNNCLVVKYGDKGIGYKYFDEIKVKDEQGGNEIANLILRFRKAFYDYIYKSRKQAITSSMFDEIMLTSITSDLRHDKFKEGYHSKETSIKEKLNIWFSLYNNFNNKSKNREDMAKTFKELLKKIDLVANDPEVLLDTEDVGEFLFAAGQIIYFLLSKSKTSNPTFAMLEPFLQKTNAVQLQNAIGTAVNMYKHELGTYKDRFQRLASQVLVFPTDENLKNYQRYLLAGCFAPAVIYKSTKEKELQEELNN